MRILHLIDPDAPGGGACTLRLLATAVRGLSAIEHDVFVIGSRSAQTLAQRCGIAVAGRIAAPLRQPTLARRALRRVLRERERVFGPVDVLQGWTLGSTLLAATAAPGRPRVATLTVGPVTELATRLMLLRLDQHPTKLLAVSPAVADEYRAVGVPPPLLDVLPPAIDVTPDDAAARRAVRERWGVDDGTFVVGALAQPVAWSDARQAIDLVGRAALTKRPVSLVLHPSAARRAESVRWAGAIGLGPNMIFDAQLEEPWRMCAGLDAAVMIRDEWNAGDLRDAGALLGLIMGGGSRMRPAPGVLPALWAMGAGVPVITEDLPAVKGVVVHDATGFLVDPRDVNTVTEQILRMFDDPPVKRRVGDAARELVAQRFGADAFCAGLEAAYQEVAGVGAGAALTSS